MVQGILSGHLKDELEPKNHQVKVFFKFMLIHKKYKEERRKKTVSLRKVVKNGFDFISV